MTTAPDLTDAHRGHLFMDNRWRCVCGWTSPRGLTRADAVTAAGEHHHNAHTTDTDATP